ncbi:MAG: hypothetical protein J1F35_00550 [Erysipelotrichales bacterium]|nr:hypothetical protein [Erysipelotrichales bacterium]
MANNQEVMNFFTTLKENNYEFDFDEISSIKGRQNYEILKDLALKTNANLDLFDIVSILPEDVLIRSTQILKILFEGLFPPITVSKIISKMKVYGGVNPYNGHVVKMNGEQYIAVECIDKVTSVITVVHEGSHILLPAKYVPNYHHREVIPILNELVAASTLDELKLGSNNLESTYAYRVNNLKYHFSPNNEFDDSVLKNNDGITYEKIKYIYDSHTDYTYIISIIYALNLFALYQEDRKQFLNVLRSSLINDPNIYSLYQYYGLDFKDEKILDEPTNILKKYL